MIDTLFKTEAINKEEQYCVYCHRNKINGKQYIGQTKHQDNLVIRTGSDGRGYFHNKYFKRAIQKYGWDNFEHYIIQGNLTKEEADELEKLNILVFNTNNKEFGYNIDKGGSHGGSPATEHQKEVARQTFLGREPWNKGKTNVISEETRQKMGEAKRGNKVNLGRHHSEEAKQKISEGHKDIKLSAEHKQKLSEGHKGKKLSEEAKQKISESMKGRQPASAGKHRVYDDLEHKKYHFE